MNSRSELHMRIVISAVFILSILSSDVRSEQLLKENPMIQHPEWYIKILDWSFYVAWGGVAIIHNVAIENTSSVGYKDIKVRVNYYSTTGSNYGIQVGQEIGFLPVTLPPKSKNIYLKDGAVLGLGSTNLRAGAIEVLSAVPLIQ
ncbi:MAG: hypothetical protein WBD99_04765 [Thermodesulfobacteriota bacterium]